VEHVEAMHIHNSSIYAQLSPVKCEVKASTTMANTTSMFTLHLKISKIYRVDKKLPNTNQFLCTCYAKNTHNQNLTLLMKITHNRYCVIYFWGDITSG